MLRSASAAIVAVLASAASGLAPAARPPPRWASPAATRRASAPLAVAAGENDALASEPTGPLDLLQLAGALLSLDATPLALAQLTDAIDQPGVVRDATPSAHASAADSLRRARRMVLLADMLRTDRAAYLETVSFLSIPRNELPNLQDVPIRACDAPVRPDVDPLVDGMNADGLVPDCTLPELAMGENLAEGALLRITRNIYSDEIQRERLATPGIRGLVEEMRSFMLSPEVRALQIGEAPVRQE